MQSFAGIEAAVGTILGRIQELTPSLPLGGGHRFGSRCGNLAATAQSHREPEVGERSLGKGTAGHLLNQIPSSRMSCPLAAWSTSWPTLPAR